MAPRSDDRRVRSVAKGASKKRSRESPMTANRLTPAVHGAIVESIMHGTALRRSESSAGGYGGEFEELPC